MFREIITYYKSGKQPLTIELFTTKRINLITNRCALIIIILTCMYTFYLLTHLCIYLFSYFVTCFFSRFLFIRFYFWRVLHFTCVYIRVRFAFLHLRSVAGWESGISTFLCRFFSMIVRFMN